MIIWRQIIRILLLDIETAPNIATVWGLFKQNIGINQLLDSGYVLCWSAKWLNDPNIIYSSVNNTTPLIMLQTIHALLEAADAVIHYNGTRFDIPTLNKEFLLYGLPPPAPYKQIDLLKVARNQFKFPSNKLDYVANALGVGKKHKHIGHQLWLDCMNKQPEAWAIMEEYNKQDVVLLEKVYYKLLPWIKSHANYSIYTDKIVCTNCGSGTIHRRGFSFTQAAKYRRYQCQDCGSWFRSGKSEALGPDNKTIGI